MKLIYKKNGKMMDIIIKKEKIIKDFEKIQKYIKLIKIEYI
jgi:hypothetical protein